MTEPESEMRTEFMACREELLRALKYNGDHFSLDDIWDGIQRGEFQLWVAEHSVIISQVIDTPRQRVLFFMLAAGRMEELRELSQVVLEAGKEMGCTKASLTGRPGWARSWLTKAGWKSTHIVMGLDL